MAKSAGKRSASRDDDDIDLDAWLAILSRYLRKDCNEYIKYMALIEQIERKRRERK
jgi:hypothetical protein